MPAHNLVQLTVLNRRLVALMGSAMSSHGGAVLILTMSVTKARRRESVGLLETSGLPNTW